MPYEQADQIKRFVNATAINGFIVQVPDNFTMFIDKPFAEYESIIPVSSLTFNEVENFISKNNGSHNYFLSNFIDEHHSPNHRPFKGLCGVWETTTVL